MARTIQRRALSRGRRPGGTWGRNLSALQTTVPAASKVLVGSFALSTPGIGETVRRTLGEVGISSDQTGAIEQQLGAFGCIVVTDTALAAGVASLPGPATESSDDGWFVWQGLMRRGDASLTAPIIDVFKFDSKAMRRNEEGFSVALVAENTHATHGYLLHLNISLYATRH